MQFVFLLQVLTSYVGQFDFDFASNKSHCFIRTAVRAGFKSTNLKRYCFESIDLSPVFHTQPYSRQRAGVLPANPACYLYLGGVPQVGLLSVVFC